MLRCTIRIEVASRDQPGRLMTAAPKAAEPGESMVVKVPLGARRKPKDTKFWLISS